MSMRPCVLLAFCAAAALAGNLNFAAMSGLNGDMKMLTDAEVRLIDSVHKARKQDDDAVRDDDDVAPSPPSIGADVPVTYFGPAPSQVQRELIGPFQLLKSGTLDLDEGTITIPLYEGALVVGGGDDNTTDFFDVSSLKQDESRSIWFCLTDTTDKGNGEALGLNVSPKLHFANTGRGARWALQGRANTIIFNEDSLVDFSPVRSVTPHTPDDANPNFFPPDAVQPGSVGADGYSPLAYISNLGAVYNAPVLASADATADELNEYCDGVPEEGEAAVYARSILHDSVKAICPREQTVTLELVQGFSFARPVMYLSLDAWPDIPAALEGATLAPGLADVQVGADDSFGSAVERLFAVINGFTNSQDIPLEEVPVDNGDNSDSDNSDSDSSGSDSSSSDMNNMMNMNMMGSPETVLQPIVQNHPGRSGFNSALQGEGGPLNVLGGIPTIATDYSPLWDVNIGMWTDAAVAAGFRTRWLEEFQILGFVERGFVTGPGGAEFSSSGALVNCPIVFRFL